MFPTPIGFFLLPISIGIKQAGGLMSGMQVATLRYKAAFVPYCAALEEYLLTLYRSPRFTPRWPALPLTAVHES